MSDAAPTRDESPSFRAAPSPRASNGHDTISWMPKVESSRFIVGAPGMPVVVAGCGESPG